MQHEFNPYGNKGSFLYEFAKKSLYFDTNNRSSRVLKNMLIMVAENVAVGQNKFDIFIGKSLGETPYSSGAVMNHSR